MEPHQPEVNVDVSAIMEFLRQFGLPTFCLLMIAWALWRMINWSATHVALPVTQRVITFLDKIEGAVSQQSAMLQTVSDAVKQLGSAFERQNAAIGDLGKVRETQEQLLRHVRALIHELNDLRRTVDHVGGAAKEAVRNREDKA